MHLLLVCLYTTVIISFVLIAITGTVTVLAAYIIYRVSYILKTGKGSSEETKEKDMEEKKNEES